MFSLLISGLAIYLTLIITCYANHARDPNEHKRSCSVNMRDLTLYLQIEEQVIIEKKKYI